MSARNKLKQWSKHPLSTTLICIVGLLCAGIIIVIIRS